MSRRDRGVVDGLWQPAGDLVMASGTMEPDRSAGGAVAAICPCFLRVNTFSGLGMDCSNRAGVQVLWVWATQVCYCPGLGGRTKIAHGQFQKSAGKLELAEAGTVAAICSVLSKTRDS